MANSKFEYVRRFEQEDTLLKECWIVLRLDGHAFHRFSAVHNFTKPNDYRALNLMNDCATRLMREYGDIVLGYGQSDEFSFVLHKATVLWNRRGTKIQTCLVSYFTSCYVLNWTTFFPDTRLQYPPSFDARVVLYPTKKILKDYLYWRQVDCNSPLTSGHINNLYNTVFWALVSSGLSETEAEKRLAGTTAADKNNILFEQFAVNYNKEPEQFRRGSVALRLPVPDPDAASGKKKAKTAVAVVHEDMVKQHFWLEHADLLANRRK